MKQDTEKILDRGEKLDSLMLRSSELELRAEEFKAEVTTLGYRVSLHKAKWMCIAM